MTAPLRLGFEERSFAEAISQEIATPGVTPVAAADRFVSNQFAMCVRDAMGDRLIKPPAVRVNSRGTGSYSTLARLARDGHALWYTELRFSTRHTDAVAEMPIDPFGYVLLSIDYGYGRSEEHTS